MCALCHALGIGTIVCGLVPALALGQTLPPVAAPAAGVGEDAARVDATVPATEPAVTDQTPPAAPEFIKGEITHVGTRRLLSRFDHVSVATGPLIIGNDLFLGVTPGMAYYGKSLSLSFGLPLNLRLVEGGTYAFGQFRIRSQDWDEMPDYARVIRFFTIGRKEDHLYFTVNSIRPATIGHGMLMNKYQGNVDVDRSMTGLMFDAYNRYAGFQFQTNDLTTVNRVVGALVFVKPLSFVTEGIISDSLSLGLEYVADFAAPRCIRTLLNPDDATECVKGTGNFAGSDPFTGEFEDRTFARSNPETGRFDVTTAGVHALGFSGEIKLFKNERNDLKAFVSWDKFANEGGGDGFSAGLLARLNAGSTSISAFRLQAELRTFGDGFLPGYFDSTYEVQKYAYTLEENPYQVTPTKYQAIFGDSRNGFERPNDGRRLGYAFEASWGIYEHDRRGKRAAIGVGLADSTGPNDTNLYLHLELPRVGFVQFFGTYMRVAEESVGHLAGDGLLSPETFILSGARFEVLPFLFVNAHYTRNFRIVRSPGAEYHLGNAKLVDARGNPSPFFPETPLFENVHSLFVELELGWEFSDEPTVRHDEEKES
ncbi:MAG: hypothetical protein HY903_03790 [Deltaproteobacteria bacterium]|nr:hypothetical protein [Deltaproteobacteria bacterium]